MKPPSNVSPASSSHLAFALLWLPRDRREDAMAFYRFCREVDDLADEPGLAPGDRRVGLDGWLARIRDGADPAIERLIERYEVPRSLLAEIVHGCAMDVEPRRFGTVADLEAYCWKVACAVGLISIRIFGCRSPESESYAVHLGYALQWTNILRDVGEDAGAGRVYLPLEDLARFGVTEREILDGAPGPGFLPLMAHEASRARARFAAAVAPAVDRRALLAPEIMRALYLKILLRLERRRFPVFGERIRLSRSEKLVTALAVAARIRFFSASNRT